MCVIYLEPFTTTPTVAAITSLRFSFSFSAQRLSSSASSSLMNPRLGWLQSKPLEVWHKQETKESTTHSLMCVIHPLSQPTQFSSLGRNHEDRCHRPVLSPFLARPDFEMARYQTPPRLPLRLLLPPWFAEEYTFHLFSSILSRKEQFSSLNFFCKR